METRDIIIICMLSAACLMVILCKMSTDDIILTSTFRAGMSSLAVILGIVTLGTTFIDAHLTEIKDIAGDIFTNLSDAFSISSFFYLRFTLLTGSDYAVNYSSGCSTQHTNLGNSCILCCRYGSIRASNVSNITRRDGI